MKITDLPMEPRVNSRIENTPTEKSQIVLHFGTSTNLVLRFNSVKKGEKEYAKLLKAWNTALSPPYNVDGDMFVSTVDLSKLEAVSFVDHAKRAKFVPFAQ